jgi:hypothetical protein
VLEHPGKPQLAASAESPVASQRDHCVLGTHGISRRHRWSSRRLTALLQQQRPLYHRRRTSGDFQ